MNRSYIKKTVLSALFLALGFILPMLIGQIPAIGQMLLPMHIPVFICAFVCDGRYGATVGFVLPILRSLLFSVPVMYPTATTVAFEMGTYGLIAGALYAKSKRKSIPALYFSMLVAMIFGRCVRCVAEIVLLGFAGNTFVWKVFFSGVILNAIPGILLQLVIVPAVLLLIRKVKWRDDG